MSEHPTRHYRIWPQYQPSGPPRYRWVGSNASCHSHSLENATHLAGTGVQVLIYMGQMQPASSSIRWSVDARCDSHTDFHLQQKIEYKSGFHGNDLQESGIFSLGSIRYSGVQLNIGVLACSWGLKVVTSDFKKFCVTISCHGPSTTLQVMSTPAPAHWDSAVLPGQVPPSGTLPPSSSSSSSV